MKKLFLLSTILSLFLSAKPQDFSAICESGQPLYYKITDRTNNLVEIVYPGSSSYFGNRRALYPWDGYARPVGKVVLPSQVEYNGVTYKVVSIGMRAFEGCDFITSITFPSTIEKIDVVSFEGCRNISEIRVQSGNPVYDSRDNCNAVIETKENELVFGCKNTVIPKTVTSIGWYAFRGTGLTSITIPNSVEYISSDAFYNCWITSLDLPSSIKNLGDAPFDCNMVTASLATTPLKLEAGKYYFEEYYDNDEMSQTACVVPCGMKKTYENSPWGKFFTFWENCEKHTIKVDNEGNGKVTLSTTEAKFGETISVYYNPEPYSEEFYIVVCQTDYHRTTVPLRSNTFIMPPYDVTIKVLKR